jgi:hypothetical protein
MENDPFLRNQISNLFPDKELYLESMFFKQLHRLYESYRVREEKLRREMAEKERRRLDRESERIRKKQRVEDERQKWRDQREEERKLREEERKYPIEDLELLEEEGVRSENAIPLSSSDFDGITGGLLGELIMAWQTISTFRTFVGIQSISLEALVEGIASKSTSGTHVGLVKIFMAFLKVILSEKSFTSLLDDLVVEGNIKVSDLFVNTERTYGICERPYTDMLNAITWQEILRQLMSKALGIDPSIGHVEPLVGCEIVRQTLYMQANSAPFNTPVDTTLKGLEDYPDIIKRPMDLGTIKKRIDSGGYEGSSGYDNFAEDVRLVWENAVLYNGEESEVGRAALALSDIFEQDYERFVVGRVRANRSRIEGCKREKEELDAKKTSELDSFTYAGVVYGLYSFEFHEVRRQVPPPANGSGLTFCRYHLKLPTAYKIGALSWVCNEFLNLSRVRYVQGISTAQVHFVRWLNWQRCLGWSGRTSSRRWSRRTSSFGTTGRSQPKLIRDENTRRRPGERRSWPSARSASAKTFCRTRTTSLRKARNASTSTLGSSTTICTRRRWRKRVCLSWRRRRSTTTSRASCDRYVG